MLLTIDVGNTNITMGVFDGEEIRATSRMTAKRMRTADEFGIDICDMIRYNKVQIEDITDVIIASVVPDVMYSLRRCVEKYFRVKPIIVEAGIKTGIRITTVNPKQVGSDRIVDAVAAYEIYGGPVIVVDYGTATTYDLVDKDGTFLAGVTAPGIKTSAEALSGMAAQLPQIEILKPEHILAKETITSMQAGIVYGQIGQTEYIIKKMKEESGMDNIKVVATGGLGVLIAEETEVIDIYDANLTLKGMQKIFAKQK
ncbi:MAG: type III pantothenate kinase [Lachnospiraceae bacterium]|nr:type III pantothenate kinase [Lachnospiraceae bacterium]